MYEDLDGVPDAPTPLQRGLAELIRQAHAEMVLEELEQRSREDLRWRSLLRRHFAVASAAAGALLAFGGALATLIVLWHRARA
jgi:hypothetical protein